MDAPTEEKPILMRGYDSSDAGNLLTDQWFVIKHTGDGSTQVSKIFHHQRKLDFQLSSFALIGSSLYVFGGQLSNRDSDLIFRLDTQDPTAGWKKCRCRLPFGCSSSIVAVAGNFIYLFPQQYQHQILWGCLFDTSKETIRCIKPPRPCFDCMFSSCFPWDPVFCAAFDDGPGSRGVLVSKSDGGHIYLYNPDQDSWKSCCHYRFSNASSASLPRHAVLNGKLYLSYCDMDCKEPIILCAYEILTGQLIGEFKVPKFRKLNPDDSDTEPFLVAIADYKLCYLWHRYVVGFKSTLCIAKVLVSPNSGAAVSVSEEEFFVNALGLNFIPFHSFPDQNKDGEESNYVGMQHHSFPDRMKDGEESDYTGIQ